MLKHLTHTGYYAGQTLCGAPRVSLEDGVHAVYTRPDVIKARRFPGGQGDGVIELCEKCCQVWEDIIGEEDDDAR